MRLGVYMDLCRVCAIFCSGFCARDRVSSLRCRRAAATKVQATIRCVTEWWFVLLFCPCEYAEHKQYSFWFPCQKDCVVFIIDILPLFAYFHILEAGFLSFGFMRHIIIFRACEILHQSNLLCARRHLAQTLARRAQARRANAAATLQKWQRYERRSCVFAIEGEAVGKVRVQFK